MNENFFKGLESEILNLDESILFSEKKIRGAVEKAVLGKLNSVAASRRGFLFEAIVCDFFENHGFEVVRSKKTRDLGIDALVSTELQPFGKLSLGVQAKYKRISSKDVDLFLQALRFSEIALGVVVCKEAGRLDKYTLSSKLRGLLFGLGKKADLGERIDLNPVFVLKFSELINIFAKKVRSIVKGIYKR